MNFYFLSLISLIPAFLCAYQARKRSRHAGFWFLIGFCFGFCGLLVLYLVDPIKNFLMRRGFLKPKPVAQESVQPLPSTHLLWHYLDSNRKAQGPVSFQALTSMWQSGQILDQTYVWNEELEDWKQIRELPSFFKDDRKGH